MRTLMFTLIFLTLAGHLMAQRFSGVSESQYSGYLGTTINPANIVNPNYKVDIHLLSFNTSFANDYLTISVDSLVSGQGDFFDRFENKNNNSNYANAISETEITWLGGMIGINEKMGIGFGIKSRAIFNGTGFNKDLIRMAASSLEDSTYYGQSFTDQHTSLSIASWNEYSLSFGAEVMNKGVHKVNVGGAAKLLQSNGSFYLHGNDLSYEFQDEDTIANVSGVITYGGNFPGVPSSLAGVISPVGVSPTSTSNFGFAMDIGATYEYTPDGADGYKLKAGLSFHDIGFLAATPELEVSNRITLTNQDIPVDLFDGINDLSTINDRVIDDTSYTYNRPDRGYMMQTPTRMNLFVDYNVTKGFYVSFLGDVALYRRNNGEKLVGINSFELTPRYDFKWFGFALPVSYVQYAGVGVGLGFRVGPVYFGTSNLVTSFNAGNEFSTLNLYAGLRIPIHKRGE